MLDRIEFLLSEAFVALRRNGWMTFAAISTAAVALFLLGGLGYVYIRASQSIESFSQGFETRVFLKKGTPYEKITQTAQIIRTFDGVKSVIWIPKEKAWEKMQKESPQITAMGLDNVLPDAFKVLLTDLEKSEDVRKKIQALEVVRENGVVANQDEEVLMKNLLNFSGMLGGGLGILLTLTAGILIYNAIRLTVIARRREIRIMQLVGATQFTVRTPFVIEGIIQGAVGGIVAAVLIWSAQSGLRSFVDQMVIGKAWPPFPTRDAILILGASGGAFGAFCSWLAVREPLKFRSVVQQ